MPQISVIIPTYNREQFIGEALQSALDQTCQAFEVIVIDDGSTDRTEQIVRQLSNPIPILYQWQPNQGQAVSLNRGVSASSGEWIAFLDSDDLWYPHKLAVQVQHIETYPDVPFFYSAMDYFYVDNTGQPQPTTRGWDSPLIPLIFQGQPNAHMPTVVLRKDIFHRFGGFKASLRLGESWELFARIAGAYPIYYIPQSLAKQRLHPDQTTRDLERRAENYHHFHACMWELWRDEPGKQATLLRETIKVYENLGKHFRRSRNYLLARQCFRRAYSYKPWSLRNLRRWIFSSVPGLQQLYYGSCKVR